MGEPHDPRGNLVRPYAVTRGRTEPRRDIPIEAVLVASQPAVQEARFAGHDKYRIAVLCEPRRSRWPRSRPTAGSRSVWPGFLSPTWSPTGF